MFCDRKRMAGATDDAPRVRVDLHVHSHYSMAPGSALLDRYGVPASYGDPETVYREARARGMDYVTLTDYDGIDGCLELVERHPEDCFTSVEMTVREPESGTAVALLIFGLDAGQFARLRDLRGDLQQVRDYLAAQRLAHSVAHASMARGGNLSADVLEKLVLLFNVFEGTNTAEPQTRGEAWLSVLASLSEEHINRLSAKHGIRPIGDRPWVKGLTGGSNGRCGPLSGMAWTACRASSMDQLLVAIRDRQAVPGGRWADCRSTAIAVHEMAGRYCRHASFRFIGGPIWQTLCAAAQRAAPAGPGRWWVRWTLVQASRRGRRGFREASLSCSTQGDVDALFDDLSAASDAFFIGLAELAEERLRTRGAAGLAESVLAVLPMAFLASPLHAMLKHLHATRHVSLPPCRSSSNKRVSWFSDTVTDLNGVAVTLKELAHRAHVREKDLKLITCLGDDESRASLPPNVVYLPCIRRLNPEFYDGFTLRVPSFMRALAVASAQQPDEIIISTPGPVGIVGLLVARMLEIPCAGIYHTDLTSQLDQIIAQPPATAMMESFTHGFFRLMDELRVPTEQYIDTLAARGLDRDRMTIFRRGIDASFLSLCPRRQAEIRNRHGLNGGGVLLWVGRMGKEKNLDFLLDIFTDVQRRCRDAQLLMVGDGPERGPLRQATAGNPGITLADRMERSALADYYAIADAFVFPSTTDTFGMVVLEAQACGTPALVTNVGGPQELVCHGETGYVLDPGDVGAWSDTIVDLIDRKQRDPQAYEQMRQCIRDRSGPTYGWDHVLDDIMGTKHSEGS